MSLRSNFDPAEWTIILLIEPAAETFAVASMSTAQMYDVIDSIGLIAYCASVLAVSHDERLLQAI